MSFSLPLDQESFDNNENPLKQQETSVNSLFREKSTQNLALEWHRCHSPFDKLANRFSCISLIRPHTKIAAIRAIQIQKPIEWHSDDAGKLIYFKISWKINLWHFWGSFAEERILFGVGQLA